MSTIFHCCREERRVLVEASSLNAIDFVEIPAGDQRSIRVVFLKSTGVASWTPDQFRILGGDRVRAIRVLAVSPITPSEIRLQLDRAGDFSPYELAIVTDATTSEPPPGFDPILSRISFSFKAGCPASFDPKQDTLCPPETAPAPAIDYLAKDYASFRTLLLDRLSVTSPAWRDRSPADQGVMLVELLAHVGDLLSQRQDAIATEAYLHTARRRTSVRRHARLVDYAMHDGCNARAWVHLRVVPGRSAELLPKRTMLLSRIEGQSIELASTPGALRELFALRPIVFESMHDSLLYSLHNELRFHTWGDERCCLPKGATSAFLADPTRQLAGDASTPPSLHPGMALIFEELRSPSTDSRAQALASDGHPARRHVVRLTRVTGALDPLGTLDAGTRVPLHLAAIEWSNDDALPFPLCLDQVEVIHPDGSRSKEPVSIARGNLVLVDHGRTIPAAPFGPSSPLLEQGEVFVVPTPKSTLSRITPRPTDWCTTPQAPPERHRFTFSLRGAPVTQACAYRDVLATLSIDASAVSELDAGVLSTPHRDALHRAIAGIDRQALPVSIATVIPGRLWIASQRLTLQLAADGSTLSIVRGPSARASLQTNPAEALAAVSLFEHDSTGRLQWSARHDLFESEPSDRDFVVEVEDDDTATLRFGDGANGRLPTAGTTLACEYRIGNGSIANVGAESIAHIVLPPELQGLVQLVRNPLPTSGGTEPESTERVRQRAPFAFRTNRRAVTPEDYANRAKAHPSIRNAVATFRNSGSWRTVFITVDPLGGGGVSTQLERDLREFIEPFRLAGVDLEIDSPVFVALRVELSVEVEHDHVRDHVAIALARTFSANTLPDGTRGFFHPDRLTFAKPVHLSEIYEAAQSVPGVASVIVTKFAREDRPDDTSALASGTLDLGWREIPRLDNDPNFPDRGTLRFSLRGGR